MPSGEQRSWKLSWRHPTIAGHIHLLTIGLYVSVWMYVRTYVSHNILNSFGICILLTGHNILESMSKKYRNCKKSVLRWWVSVWDMSPFLSSLLSPSFSRFHSGQLLLKKKYYSWNFTEKKFVLARLSFSVCVRICVCGSDVSSHNSATARNCRL